MKYNLIMVTKPICGKHLGILSALHVLQPQDITAESFNDYFAKLGTNLAERLDDTTHILNLPESIHTFELQPVDTSFIARQLQILKDNSNLDILNIDTKLLKAGAHIIAPSLSVLLNLSINEGRIPDDWKSAKVTPIYKGKGSIEDCGNYRPISVISHVAKIMEKAILVQLTDYITSHSFITCCQSAFRKNHFTKTALHRVMCDILDGIN